MNCEGVSEIVSDTHVSVDEEDLLRRIRIGVVGRTCTESQLLSTAIGLCEDMRVVYQANIVPPLHSVEAASAQVVVHVCDLSNDSLATDEILRPVRAVFPNAALAVMSSCVAPHTIRAAMKAGAAAYLHFGSVPVDELTDILRMLALGQHPIFCECTRRRLEHEGESSFPDLSAAHLELVLMLPELIRGEINLKSVAVKLSIPYSSVRKRLQRLMQATSAASVFEVYQLALDHDLFGLARSRLQIPITQKVILPQSIVKCRVEMRPVATCDGKVTHREGSLNSFGFGVAIPSQL